MKEQSQVRIEEIKNSTSKKILVLVFSLLATSCNAPDKSPKSHDSSLNFAEKVAFEYLGLKTVQQPHLGIDTSRLVMVRSASVDSFFSIVFHDSSKAEEIEVLVDSTSNCEVFLSQIRSKDGSPYLILK